MKKILFFAALAISLCASSCQKSGYTISGTIEGAKDGDTVLLISTNNRAIDTLVVATIKDEKFTISGQQDSADFAYLVYQNDQLHQQAQVVLENADIQVTMKPGTELPVVSGTLMNEQWMTFLGKIKEVNEKSGSIYEKMTKADASDEEKANAQKELEGIQQEMVSFFKTFIAGNIQNMVGQHLLANVADEIGDDDFVDTQLAAIEEKNITSTARDLKQRRSVAAATAVGKPFKDIKAPTPEGTELAVSDVAKNAKVLMIDFWASWCGPCRQEMPNVKAAYQKFHAQGFEIIGVSLDKEADAWKKAISDLGMTWPQISDLKGWECEGASAYSVRAIPATVLIKDGKIVARNVRGEEIATKVQELLK